jgi:hypothetical protein
MVLPLCALPADPIIAVAAKRGRRFGLGCADEFGSARSSRQPRLSATPEFRYNERAASQRMTEQGKLDDHPGV